MSKRIGTHLRSNVIGYLALFIALSGTAYAAGKVNSSQIANNAVLSKHIHKGTIRSVDVKDGGLLPKDIRGLSKTMTDVGDLQKALHGIGPYVSSLEARIAALESKNVNLQGTISGLTTQINGLLGSLGVTDLSALGLRLDAVCSQVGSLTSKVGDLRNTLNALALLLGSLNGITIPSFDTTVCHS